jgi:phage terminase large subunit
MSKKNVEFITKLHPFVTNPKRFNVLYGGRGGGKSHGVADALLIWCLQSQVRVLCTREIQRSIKESVHQLLADKIVARGYSDLFLIANTTIYCKLTGSQFFFSGLQDRTSQSLKSFEGADWCWVEEAQAISKRSLDILIPTIRKQGSKIVFTMNRDEEDDAVFERFCVHSDEDTQVINININDNPFKSETLADEEKRAREKAERTGDFSDYSHVWLGQPTKRHNKIFRRYRVEDFDATHFDQIREGLDWGFSDDPLAWVKVHFDRKRETLYVIDELYLRGHSNASAFEKIKAKTTRHTPIIADSSEPKSIEEGKNCGLYLLPADKGHGSVEHGIKFLQGLEIIIHPSCTNTAEEFRKYRYKEDRQGNVLPSPVDRDNHAIDAIRYALERDTVGVPSHKFYVGKKMLTSDE